jgi:ribosomal protein S18 acetylase RimI-like enzyme
VLVLARTRRPSRQAHASTILCGADATRRFLDEPGHHLLIAYDGDTPAGFVTGVELTHPDKGTEMLLYELAVAEKYRRRAIRKALVAALTSRVRGAVASDQRAAW